MGRRPTPHSANETTDPSKVPLPKTPTKTAEGSRGRKAPTAVFSATGERSPYFQDSHMVTPKSVNRTEDVRTTADNSGDKAHKQELGTRFPTTFPAQQRLVG
ncbi:unnamed protein product [Phytophthora lilii]|uniref:Unnamed protein product n=1 Tax=Phytophthora lilii TaxID=2077276 RepID=A0A9W6XGI5_9STRA|nr:unnamed protein product [Phytophthora lilii]